VPFDPVVEGQGSDNQAVDGDGDDENTEDPSEGIDSSNQLVSSPNQQCRMGKHAHQIPDTSCRVEDM
jgi:hypothetical protein